MVYTKDTYKIPVSYNFPLLGIEKRVLAPITKSVRSSNIHMCAIEGHMKVHIKFNALSGMLIYQLIIQTEKLIYISDFNIMY